MTVKPQASSPKPEAGLDVLVEKAGGTKCDRCWRYVPAVSEAPPERAGLCPRCVEALAEPVSL